LASQVLEFSLIKADGNIQVFKKGDAEFNGTIINLGALGVKSENTLQVTDAFNLHDKTYTIDFEWLIDKIDELINGTTTLKFGGFRLPKKQSFSLTSERKKK